MSPASSWTRTSRSRCPPSRSTAWPTRRRGPGPRRCPPPSPSLGGPDQLLDLEDRGLVTGAPALLDGHAAGGAAHRLRRARAPRAHFRPDRRRHLGAVDRATTRCGWTGPGARLPRRRPGGEPLRRSATAAASSPRAARRRTRTATAVPVRGTTPTPPPTATRPPRGGPRSPWDRAPEWWRVVADHVVDDPAVTVRLSAELADGAPAHGRRDAPTAGGPRCRWPARRPRSGCRCRRVRPAASPSATAARSAGHRARPGRGDLPGVRVRTHRRRRRRPRARSPRTPSTHSTHPAPAASPTRAGVPRCSCRPRPRRRGARRSGPRASPSPTRRPTTSRSRRSRGRGPRWTALIASARGERRPLAGPPPTVTATASSSAVPDPRAGAAAAVDGDPGPRGGPPPTTRSRP